MNPRFRRPRAYANWMLANFEVALGTSRVRARPLKLTFDPTNVCQLKCPLCPTGLQIPNRGHGHAQLELFQRLLEEVGDYVFFIDFFNWGEPLLNTHVEDFIRLASARNIVSSMSTNLSLPLTDDRIDRIVSSGLGEMIVSLDGASEATYSIYRKQGKFDLVVDNMRRVARAKQRLGLSNPFITWQFLVFRFNEHEQETARQLATEGGADRIVFRSPYLDVERYPLSETDRKTMAGWRPTEPLYQINSTAKASKRYSRCGWHYTSSAINWDGSVASCCTTFDQKDDFGSLGKSGQHSYMEVINNEAFRSVRDRFAGRRKEPVALICENCPTPDIMDYHQALNRQIVLLSFASLLRMGRRLFGGKRDVEPRPLPVADISKVSRGQAAQ
jgi:MoaA/NifB/PqqE/SkfB family radical SAM enzyme